MASSGTFSGSDMMDVSVLTCLRASNTAGRRAMREQFSSSQLRVVLVNFSMLLVLTALLNDLNNGRMNMPKIENFQLVSVLART